ncbi:phenylalanine--tRNA ligase beta subunit-related protein [Streptomyces sp. MST-110588]|uniref:B3/B4 domain-containing protein n=1 Tax=Streptomyces sp. MST-110588 TaxID=2833628 RepID=UPI001F5DAC3E|nr:phenylalanine--tRNA ligase beta subunit-related protein [Streptomyces sp. MST-110588]UNO43498.1 hypothetical protein KGS77_33505 [Streptomyces sp. MST-110588]
MYFRHSPDIWQDFPELVPGVLYAKGITGDVSVGHRAAKYNAIAESRLGIASEGELPEIQAWRRTFSRMGHKPTQYRCAAESLLRRFKKEGSLPSIHPLIDLCNAISLAYAIPVGVFDVSRLSGSLEVAYATGKETYETLSGQTEPPAPGEVVFVDDAGHAHARRWTHRQSGRSAVRDTTTDVLIVAEAMHDSAIPDIQSLMATIAEELGIVWSVPTESAVLASLSPRFDF